MAKQLLGYTHPDSLGQRRRRPFGRHHRWEGLNLTDIKGRLERGAVALAVIDLRRRHTQDPSVGAAAERFIVERELKELADETVAAGRREGTTETRPRKRRAVMLATAGRWFRK